MRGTSGTLRHSKRSRYRCSLPGLAGFAGLRRTEPEVPRIGSRSTHKRLRMKFSTATLAKKENDVWNDIPIFRILEKSNWKLGCGRSDLHVEQQVRAKWA